MLVWTKHAAVLLLAGVTLLSDVSSVEQRASGKDVLSFDGRQETVIDFRIVGQDGFSCDNGTTYCPTGSTCCNLTQPVQKGCVINGQCCRQGVLKPASTSHPNCLVLGDSVSNGYTPLVQAALSAICQVQHTPYAPGSGGAGATSRGLACLDHFLLTDKLVEVDWDVIVFNFGLHNLDNSSAGREMYEAQLSNITKRLLVAGKKVLYASTTPFMPDYTQGNHIVEELNVIASKVMNASAIPVVDLYGTVVKQCGPLPYKSCSICRKDPCSYHYTPQGYELLAAQVMAAIKHALDMRTWCNQRNTSWPGTIITRYLNFFRPREDFLGRDYLHSYKVFSVSIHNVSNFTS